MATFGQKIATGNKTQVILESNNYDSMILTNTHATAAVTIDLWITDQSGENLTDSEVVVNNGAGYSATLSSQAVAVDNGSGGTSAATDDLLLNERIYQGNGGAFYGVCTVVNSNVLLTFGGGLVKALENNVSLHVGTRYYLLNNVVIPNGASLKLDANEFGITPTQNLYIDSSDAAGNIDIIKRLKYE
jgi:hypothetical protein|tara:strand:- start:59 stop:622 length:564 start_codon:yes stop_codon:yes gene_type:complete